MQLLGGRASQRDGSRYESIKPWKLLGCLDLETSVTLHGDLGQCLWTGRFGWWYPSLRRGTGECSDYREITLLSHHGKVYDRVLESRACLLVEIHTQGEQRTRHSGCRISNKLFMLSRVFECAWEFPHLLYICFLDLEKALDWVTQGMMWGCCGSIGVSAPLLQDIQFLYS